MPYVVRRSHLVRIGIVATVFAASAGAQPSPNAATVVRGVAVAREGAAPLPYAVVSLTPLAKERARERAAERFTSATGAFVFAGVAPGSYRLRARQLGFTPFDTTISVGGAPLAPLQLALTRVAVRLAGVDVMVDRRCTRPGVPDSTIAPELYAVFDQLRENAKRYVLLADQYPFRYSLERTYGWSGATQHVMRDTVLVRSAVRWRYRPGQVVSRAVDRPGEFEVTLPTLPDFADADFQRHHCFDYAGADTVDGTAYLRVNFMASEKLKTPDVSGSVLLDPVTYQVRQATIALTRIPQAWSVQQVTGLTATTWFREIAPSIVVVDRISATNAIRQALRDKAEEAVETQRLIDFAFERQALAGARTP